MSRKRQKKRTGTPSLPPPARSRSLPPLPLGERIAIKVGATVMCLTSLAMAYVAVRSLQTGSTPVRGGSIAAEDDLFGFYLSVVVLIVLAIYTGWMGVSIGRTK